MSALPADYLDRVYAGVLGKIIGVYLGRPVEGWTHERIMGELGEIRDYVNDRIETAGPIVVTDDDISGTFTFIRALEDFPEAGRDITPEQIGQTWLNYIIENRSIVWWGGLGVSTEHTAFLRLKNGIAPPRSGSIALNGKTVAEQIGAQIFIDAWALVSPGDPELAASLARRAACVSHDGEALHAAACLAAMEAQAFVERDINRLIDKGLSFVAPDSILPRLVDDLRRWRNKSDDWKSARAQLDVHYGYHRYGGACPVVPNFGVILLAILFSNGDFTDAISIATTAGWETDCNAGNVGCLMGIRNGLSGIRERWRAPVNDRLFLPTADGGSSITDALTQAVRLANLGASIQNSHTGVSPVPAIDGQGCDAHATRATYAPRDGAKFHFSMPGAMQGFSIAPVTATLTHESNRLRATFRGACRVAVDTFITPEQAEMPGYRLIACPTLYPGQTLSARVIAAEGASCAARFDLGTCYGDAIARRMGPRLDLKPGELTTIEWTVPDFGEPIASVGVSFDGVGPAEIDSITWSGAPDCTIGRPKSGGTLWRRAWVNACTHFHDTPGEDFTLVQNDGRGLLICGTRDWRDYEASVTIKPKLATAFGIAARVQGLNRYYALLLCNDGKARLVKSRGERSTLAEVDYAWSLDKPVALALRVSGTQISGLIDGRPILDAIDATHPLDRGAFAFALEEGAVSAGPVRVQAVR